MWKIYSLRWSVSRGWQWHLERTCCSEDGANGWRNIYVVDEPRVRFTIAKGKRKPKLPDMRTARERAPTMLGR